jgi:hypothetical protein
MVKPIYLAPLHLPMKDVVCPHHKVLVEVYNNSALIVGDPQGILGQQLRLHPMYLLNIIITLVLFKIIIYIYNIIKKEKQKYLSINGTARLKKM